MSSKRLKKLQKKSTLKLLIKHGIGYREIRVTMFEGIREYIPGDRLKDIEWKVTSRFSTLMTKISKREISMPTVILLDCSRSMRRTLDERSKIDHSVQLTLQLTKLLESREHPVELITFGEYGF
jgi:uncharacterized protein (DUF58 family)